MIPGPNEYLQAPVLTPFCLLGESFIWKQWAALIDMGKSGLLGHRPKCQNYWCQGPGTWRKLLMSLARPLWHSHCLRLDDKWSYIRQYLSTCPVIFTFLHRSKGRLGSPSGSLSGKCPQIFPDAGYHSKETKQGGRRLWRPHLLINVLQPLLIWAPHTLQWPHTCAVFIIIKNCYW